MHQMSTVGNMKLHKIIEDSSLYASEEQKVTMAEAQAFHRSVEAGAPQSPEFASYRSRIKELMLIDEHMGTALAGAESSLYGDMLTEAQAEKRTLQKQADASGMEKAKKDLLGTKKRAARAKLDRIAQSKAKLKSIREAEGREFRNGVGSQLVSYDYLDFQNQASQDFKPIQERMERLRQADRSTWTEEDKSFMKPLGKPIIGAFQRRQVVDESSPYQTRIRETTKRFYSSDQLGKKFTADSIYRDTARWSSPLHEADQVTAEEMREKANQAYVMVHGKTIDGEQKTLDEQKAALHTVKSSVELMRDEMRTFVQRNPALFDGVPGPADLAKQFSNLGEIYKKSQPITNLTKEMIHSAAFKALPEEEQQEILELRRYTSAVSQYVNELFIMGRRWSEYNDPTEGNKMPEERKPAPIPSLDDVLRLSEA